MILVPTYDDVQTRESKPHEVFAGADKTQPTLIVGSASSAHEDEHETRSLHFENSSDANPHPVAP